MKMLIARFHTLIASWLLATVLPSNFMLGGNFFALKKPDRKSVVEGKSVGVGGGGLM